MRVYYDHQDQCWVAELTELGYQRPICVQAATKELAEKHGTIILAHAAMGPTASEDAPRSQASR